MNDYRIQAKIDLDAIGKNVQGVRDRIPDETKIMAVIKADGYGHGAVVMSEYLEDKVDWYAVATTDEALELRGNGTQKPILILGYTDPSEYEPTVRHDITLTVFSYSDAALLDKEAARQGKCVDVHIKVDTGMSRIGYQVCDASADEILEISKLEHVRITGLFSHLAKADEKDKTSALEQRAQYDAFVTMLETRGIEIPVKHLNNSAGTMEMNQFYDMVRMGIMLYGLYPSGEMNRSYKLYPAMELISHITHIKLLEAGRGVSYGHTYVLDKPMLVATVPVGYADGYPRCLSNRGKVLIGGKYCPIIGRVCMDQMMVDISDVPGAKTGDEVVLVGRSGDAFISVDDVADNACSFNYEFVCGVGRRVPRVYIKNGEYYKTVSYLTGK